MKNPIPSLLILLTATIIFGQAKPVILPNKISMEFGNCDSTEVYATQLIQMVEEWGYQGNSKPFYNDNVQTVDLNGDGICEYLLKYYDGGANIQEEMYLVVNSKLEKIAQFWENTYSWSEPYNGWPQILSTYYTGHKTNPIWQFALFRFDNGEYRKYYDPNLTYGKMSDLGLKAYKQKDYETAEIYFRNILTVYGHERPVDINNLALALIKQNKLTESKKLLLEELKHKKSPLTSYNLSLIYRKEGDLKQELIHLQESNRRAETKSKLDRISEIEQQLKNN